LEDRIRELCGYLETQPERVEPWLYISKILCHNGEYAKALELLLGGSVYHFEKPEFRSTLRLLLVEAEEKIVKRLYRSYGPIFYVSQPQSASNYVEAELARRLQLFIGHEGLVNTEFHQAGTLNPDRLERFLRIGGIVREHLYPSDINIELLMHSSLSRVLVTVRDPRQCLLSEIQWAQKLGSDVQEGPRGYDTLLLKWQMPAGFFDMSPEEKIDSYIDHRLPFLVDFLERWWRVAKKEDNRLRVHIARFEDLKTDPKKFFDGILNFYGIPSQAFAGEQYQSKEGEHAFRKGALDEWRSQFNEAQKQRISELIPTSLLENYGWAQ
jgi:hypothetical protein